ncbi:aldehyde dehydrogenase family protein [Streptacidiphilus melanogenes]|uniref:aldehyde dehydrogenase family protein n=1 Tax=Streptacidiphilus melanogenes TaxID=411235 RepID=UPI0005A68370|nr:aldehyde dehydrogenase family protein [Streptacidiphilus melanogenes]
MTEPTPHRLFIASEWREGGAGAYPVINPGTESLVGHAPEASASDVADAVAAARAAQGAWAATAPAMRAALLERIADLVMEHAADFVPLLQAETGATMRVASTMQLPVVADRFRRYARGALEPTVESFPAHPVAATPLAAGGLTNAAAARRPVGVVGCITSYNFPIVNLAGKLAPALAMGNTVVAKPAPQDPLACLKLGEIFVEAGAPAGLFNVVTDSGAAAGAALVASPDVDMISFTGSTTVGRRIATDGGATMKRLLMELGGKGAAIVLQDADLTKAIPAIGSTWAFHSGQICTAPTRALVHRSRYDELVAGLARFAARLPVGDPLLQTTVVGPVISAAHRDRVEGYITGALAEGARLVLGGTRKEHTPDTPELPGTGFFVAPTLLAEVTPRMTIAREEVFGPVVVVIPFEDDEEALAIAGSTEYGLYDYVFTADTARAYALAARLRSGNVGINTAQRHPETPFGGFKQSGVGRDGGSFGLHAYSEQQAIVWQS